MLHVDLPSFYSRLPEEYRHFYQSYSVCRFGFIVSRRVGNAVKRNFIKRRFRSLFNDVCKSVGILRFDSDRTISNYIDRKNSDLAGVAISGREVKSHFANLSHLIAENLRSGSERNTCIEAGGCCSHPNNKGEKLEVGVGFSSKSSNHRSRVYNTDIVIIARVDILKMSYKSIFDDLYKEIEKIYA
jgi:RNase P protein component